MFWKYSRSIINSLKVPSLFEIYALKDERKELEHTRLELNSYLQYFLNKKKFKSFIKKDSGQDDRFESVKSNCITKGYDTVDAFFEDTQSRVKKLKASFSTTNNLENRLLELNQIGYAKLGLSLIEKDELVFVGFKPYMINIPFNWEVDPFNSRTWRCNLHQFKFIKSLLAYDNSYKDYAGFKLCMLLVVSWVHTFLYSKKVEPVWHDHSTALRTRNLFLLLIYCLSHYEQLVQDLGAEIDCFIVVLINTLQWHANVLTNRQFYSKGTNHGLDQSIALYEVTALLDFKKSNHEKNKIASKRISFEVFKGFNKDGGHSENSPGYLNFGLKQINDALKLNMEFPDSSVVEIDKSLLDKATIALTHLTKPDQKLPLIGDTVDFRVSDLFKDRLKPSKRVYENFLYSRSKGNEGVPPNNSYLFLIDSGYAIFRDAWQPKERFGNTAHLVLKAGFLSKYHRHDDDTSIVLYAHGEDWIIDSGLYKYEESDPMRIYFRSHEAHSISAPYNSKASRDIRYVSSTLEKLDESNSKASVKAKTTMFPQFSSTRTVEHYKYDNLFKLKDTVKAVTLGAKLSTLRRYKKNLPTYITRFQISADKKINIYKNYIEIVGNNKCLHISIHTEDHFDITTRRGELKPKIIGWQSCKGGTFKECNVVEVVFYAMRLNVVYDLKFINKQ